MSKFKFLSFVAYALLIAIGLNACIVDQTQKPEMPIETIRYYPESFMDMELPEHRIDILRFHHTIECEECYLIGNALLDLLQEDYVEEVTQGIITYRTVNSEYLENSNLLFEYRVMDEDFVTHVIAKDKNQMDHHHHLWLIAQDDDVLKQELKNIIEDLLSFL